MPVGAEFFQRGHGVLVAEDADVVVVGHAGGHVLHPPRRLERDPVRIGEIDRVNGAVVDDVGDLAVVVDEPLAQRGQRGLVGQVQRQVIELRLARVGHARRQRERLDDQPVVLEERHRALRTEVEEVVAKARRADRAHEGRAEHPAIEPNGRIHVGCDERQVVDAAPRRCRRVLHRGLVRDGHG